MNTGEEVGKQVSLECGACVGPRGEGLEDLPGPWKLGQAAVEEEKGLLQCWLYNGGFLDQSVVRFRKISLGTLQDRAGYRQQEPNLAGRLGCDLMAPEG